MYFFALSQAPPPVVMLTATKKPVTITPSERREAAARVGPVERGVPRRPRRVLVRGADRVAGHRGLVGLGALAAVVAVLDVLLRVVPGAAARGHAHCDEEARHDHAEQH